MVWLTVYIDILPLNKSYNTLAWLIHDLYMSNSKGIFTAKVAGSDQFIRKAMTLAILHSVVAEAWEQK